MMKMINLKHALERYHDYVILNRNLIASIVSAMLVSAVFAQTIKGLSTHVNATTTIAISYMVYYIVFGVLYYKSNKKRYKTKAGIDRQRLRKDLFKIIISVGAAEIIYLITRWILHYYFLETGQEPFTASIFAHIISASIFILIVNVGASLTKIYKPVNQSKIEDNSYLN